VREHFAAAEIAISEETLLGALETPCKSTLVGYGKFP